MSLIPKYDGRTRVLSVDGFRGISISPVIFKLFELAVLDRFGMFFVTSEHQFGFKKNLSCNMQYSVCVVLLKAI